MPLVAAAARAVGNDPALWQWAALLHRALDDNVAAVAAFERAARLNPNDARIAHGQALAALDLGRPATALFDRARRLAPSDGDILLGIAHARHADGDLVGAIAGLDALLVQHPGWLPGHHLAAHLRWLAGDRAGFTASLERALLAVPRDQGLWHALILLLLQAEAHERVLDAIRRGRAAAGPQLFFDANEAAAAAELGDIATADRIFAAIGEIDDMPFTVRRVRHLLRSGRIEQAAALAERWTRRPDANLIWPYAGLAWRLLGDPRWQWLEGDERLVGILDIGGALPSLDALADCLRGLHGDRQEQLDQSVRGGTQTRGVLFARAEPQIRALRAAIVEAVTAHIAQLPPHDAAHPLLGAPRPRAIRFSGSWSVRLGAQGHHSSHIHPAGWLSSAFYAALPSLEQRGAQPAGWLALGVPEPALGLELPPTRLIEPKPGRLVLFPSTMWHGTIPFDRGERLTVAFDVAPGLAEEG
ncbi:putative 2OG-Fe(II) oxygenase [Sphingomonas sp. Root710]|uniref:putative 2OG-Fe(II) oxygenase n=1 Tax=Sphingomonas sp. Root710 TaxID=1736594 RepID=UPI000A7631C5|nr:putative 2OG-Fe(II) oxygenase [Sphingomonas sp. Root710]